MPLLDIAIAQPSFHNHWGSTRLQLCVNGKATNCSLLQYEERWASFSIFFQNPGKIKIHLGHQRKLHPKFLVKAVATFDPKISVQSEDGGEESNASLSIDESVSSTVHTESSDADSEEIDTREKLRRMRISEVYRGTWNKGGKHSPETLQRTRERTKLALQDPKVRMKLARSCPQLSQEAGDNISAGLRMVWEQRYQRLETQVTCLFDWQNLIAEAARGGFDEEEELQWDSFEILEKQLQQEWLERLEYMKTTPRPKSDNRASKTLEEQRKVSEAIADKGADPEYRARVPLGSVKYYGTPKGTKRRMKMKLSRVGRCRRNSWSQEVKDKIGSGLRKAWKRRLQRLQNQATCLFDWQNLIAEAAREGFDEDELQWDSCETLEKQLQQEWLERMEYMKATAAPKTTNRAMTLEERRKISEGMAAKWADPEYRARVSSGLVKYYGTPEGTERRMKMKLSRLGQSRRNSCSQEARDKISAGLRKAWKRRRQRLETRATCLFDWQILIAEAAREGFDEDQLQWDSYEILEKQLRQEWLERMEYRKTTPRPKTANRAPMTLEERRNFSEAMAAKWADPEYRARFSSGLLKCYGTPEGTERRMKMKLSRLGQSRRNSRSQETRDNISAGLRKAWKRSRQRLETQATCLFDWQNLIAEAAREGFHEEEELQWDSYESLEKQLQQEWLESMEYGKTTPRPKTGNRAPKTLEERRKISEAISGGQSKRTRRIKVGDAEGSAVNELKARSRQAKVKKEYVPKYNDPLASSKLEMLKSIRAQRVASQTKTNETLEQAKVLMAEARKAVKALELVAMKSPVAQASLIEARKLIAEVTQTIEKIENGKVGSLHDAASGYHQNHVERSGNGALTEDPSDEHPIGINAIAYLESSQGHNPDFNLYRRTMLDNTYMSYHRSMRLGGYKFHGLENVDPATTEFGSHEIEVCPDRDVRSLTSANRKIDSVKEKQEFEQGDAVERLDLRALMDQRYHHPEPNGIAKLNGTPAPSRAKVHVHEAPAAKIVTKRWVCGRLVEVVEGE